jgi:hypothetical protein
MVYHWLIAVMVVMVLVLVVHSRFHQQLIVLLIVEDLEVSHVHVHHANEQFNAYAQHQEMQHQHTPLQWYGIV